MSAYLTAGLLRSTLLLFARNLVPSLSGASSRFVCANSSSIALRAFFELPTEERFPFLASLTQYDMVDFGIDKLRLTSGIVNPCSTTNFTASSRSSFVYTAFGILSMLTPPSCILHHLCVHSKHLTSVHRRHCPTNRGSLQGVRFVSSPCFLPFVKVSQRFVPLSFSPRL